MNKIIPAFKKNNIAVVFSSDDRFVYFLSVALKSLIDKISSSWNYDICIISDGIKERKKNLLQLVCSNKKNVSLRFIEISAILDSDNLKTYSSRLSRTTFARLYIPELFSEYSKVLSLDGDIIIKKDISELYNTNIDGYYFAAVPDPGLSLLYKYYEYESEYLESIGITEKDKYFNAGVLLFNIEEFKKNYSVQKMVQMITREKYHYDEQDAFNCFAKGHVKFMHFKWNLLYREISDHQKIFMSFAEYNEAFYNPNIIHYAGGVLPTNIENTIFATDFWNVARTTPCYESILNIALNNYRKNAIAKKHKLLFRIITIFKVLSRLLKKDGLIKTLKYCLYRLKNPSDHR